MAEKCTSCGNDWREHKGPTAICLEAQVYRRQVKVRDRKIENLQTEIDLLREELKRLVFSLGE